MAHLYVLANMCALPRAESRASMAIYHLSASIVKRSAGRCVTAAAAYRAAAKIEDITTGLVHDYTHKKGVDYSEILSPISTSLGNEWLTDRQELWNKIEEVERRKDAQLAREITLAIPRELSRPEQIALVREYVQTNYVAAGMVADVNLHHLDGDNPHAHILLTMRNLQTTPKGIVEFGLKNTDWNSKDLLLTHRKSWEEITNKYLANYGSDIKIDCRSLKEQGSEFIPQIHVGVHAMAMHRKGKQTDRSDEFAQIEAENSNIRARLEEIYQRESALESELERSEDHRIGELLYQNIKSYQPTDNSDKNRQTISIHRYIISKNLANGIKIQVDNGAKLLSFKLEGNTWAKTIFYPNRYSQTKYTRSDINKLVEDFSKIVENFSSELEQHRNRIELIRNEIDNRGRDRNQENEVGNSISNLINRLGVNNYYLTSQDIYSTFYENREKDRIRVYTDIDINPIYDFKLVNNKWVNQLKIHTGKYSLDNLSQLVTIQHSKFDRGEIVKLELNDEQLYQHRTDAFHRRLDIRSSRMPDLPLNNVIPPIRYYCTDEQVENIVKWAINTRDLDLSDDEPRKVVLNSNGLVQVTAKFEYYHGKNIVYRVEEAGKENGAYWMIRVNSETKEILKHYGVASKLVLEQVEEIEKLLKERQTKQINNTNTDVKIDVINNAVAEPAVIDLVPEGDKPAKQVSEEPSTPSNLTKHELILLKIQQQNERNAKEYLRKKAEQLKSQAKKKPNRSFEQ